MGSPRVTDAGDAGRVAGMLTGLVQGAGVGSVFIPIPIVGSFVGAVVGGMVGSKAGRYVGATIDKGSAVALKGATMIAAGTAASLHRPKRPSANAQPQSEKAAKTLSLVGTSATPSVEVAAVPLTKPPAARRPATRTGPRRRTTTSAEPKVATGSSEASGQPDGSPVVRKAGARAPRATTSKVPSGPPVGDTTATDTSPTEP